MGNDFLFGLDKNHQSPYGDGAYSTIITKNIFNTFSGVPTTINGLRSSYVSWHLPKLKSYNNKEKLAFDMATSVQEMEKTYYKQELASDNNDYVSKVRKI